MESLGLQRQKRQRPQLDQRDWNAPARLLITDAAAFTAAARAALIPMPLARRTLLALLALLVCLAVGARGALLHSSRSRSCVALDLRGGKRQRTSAKPGKRSMTFTDIKRNDSANEYYAGGLSEDGGGSATVLLLPDEPGENETNGTNASKFDPPPPPPKFPEGGGRKL